MEDIGGYRFAVKISSKPTGSNRSIWPKTRCIIGDRGEVEDDDSGFFFFSSIVHIFKTTDFLNKKKHTERKKMERL